MPGIGFTTIQGPEWGFQGEFLWAVKLFLTEGPELRPAPQPAESWIIQHIVVQETGTECNGTAIEPKNLDYYEAWRVGTDGFALKKYSYDFAGDGIMVDVDLTAGRPPALAEADDFLANSPNPDTRGTLVLSGSLYAVERIEPGAFSVATTKEGAGQLPRSMKAPAGLRNPSLVRQVVCNWLACETKEVSGNASAETAGQTYTESWQFTGRHRSQ